MKNTTSHHAIRAILASGLLLATSAAFSASGFTLLQSEEKEITIGMSRANVRDLLGRPAHNVKYMNEPGRSWTYGVTGTGVPRNTVFDIDFSADGKVVQVNERVEPFLK